MRKMFSQFIYRGWTNVYNTKNILQESYIITEYIGIENFKNRRLLLREWEKYPSTLNISTYFFVKEVIQLTLRYIQNVIYNHTTYPPKMVV